MGSTPGQIKNPTDFATALLGALGDPNTKTNIKNIVGWEKREGGNWHNTAKFNPLNTSQGEPGSVNYNSGKPGGGVQAYTSWQEGLDATVATLQSGNNGYPAILAALNTSQPWPEFAKAVQNSQWDGSSHYGGTLVKDSPGGGGTNVQNDSSSGSAVYATDVTATQQNGAGADQPGTGAGQMTGVAGVLQKLDQAYNPNTNSTIFGVIPNLPSNLTNMVELIFVRAMSSVLSVGLIGIGVALIVKGRSSSGGGGGNNIVEFVNAAQRTNLSNERLAAQREKERNLNARHGRTLDFKWEELRRKYPVS